MKAITCSRLIKRYEDVVAVSDVDLEIEAGECFGLLGPNGAGKTTTAEILEGLTRPTSGRVEILGKSWGGGRGPELRERIGVALQETRLPDSLTVRETVRLFRSFYRVGKSEESVIQRLGLEAKEKTWVSKLSGGQRQRLAIACAVVGSPEILFLDEPTTGLDPKARHRIWEIIEQFKAEGGTIFLTTHYMEEAAELCDRVGIMDHGRLIALGTPNALVETLKAGEIIELKVGGQVDDSFFKEIGGVLGVQKRGGLYVLRVDSARHALPELLDALHREGIEAQTLKTHGATLEDVFVNLTGKGLKNG